MTMQATRVQIVVLPQTGQRDPVAVAVGTSKPCRVAVRNLSGTTVNLGFAAQDVQTSDGLGSAIWQLPPAEVDIFVLAPGQKLYGNAAAPNARICVQISEALPLL